MRRLGKLSRTIVKRVRENPTSGGVYIGFVRLQEPVATVEAVAMTPEEWERGDSFVVDFARNGEVLYAA